WLASGWCVRRARARRTPAGAHSRRDGSVEAVIAGALEEVDGMTAAVRRGPPGARVETADVSQAGDEDLRQRLAGELFSVLRTILGLRRRPHSRRHLRRRVHRTAPPTR